MKKESKNKKKISKLHTIKTLSKKIKDLKKEGKKIVLSSGSWDLLHVGHMRYLKKAKEAGDFLIVGVDSDKKIRSRKGPSRPIVEQNERLEMLSHLEYVDALFLKLHNHESAYLVKVVQPDVLIVSETTKHKGKHLDETKKYCGKMLMLPPQAETSTSAKIRLLHIHGKKELVNKIMEEMPKFITSFLDSKS